MIGLIAFHWKFFYKYFMIQKPLKLASPLVVSCKGLRKSSEKTMGILESVSQAGVLKLTGRLRNGYLKN
jgi:hypothetical protein